MKLSQLLSAIGAGCPQDPDITALACDSRQAAPGTLFVALEGANDDGRAYIPHALERGAAAVVCAPPLPGGVSGAAVDDPRAALAALAAEFYGHPAQQLTLVAVTGTKGKTTTAFMLRDILTAAGFKTGMIGTLGAWTGTDPLSQSPNTTPEPISLHHTLRQMVDAGCSHVVMEVSSQAMKLRRVDGLRFRAALFLNLSPDHIGGAEHASFDEYRACKAMLFRQCGLALCNMQDPNWPVMAAQAPPGTPVSTFGFAPGAGVRGSGIAPGQAPLSTRFFVDGDPQPYTVPMPGAFNAQNALAALAAARALGVDDDAIRRGLASAAVPGRTQRYPAPAPFTVLIDYAHNGESFRALLQTLRPYCKGRILLLFGAGGNRPKLRRADMAHAAAQGADFAILTTDNPRFEDPEEICRDIAAELGDKIPWEIVPDRREAIFRILQLAKPGDIVALLGKGHEAYIEVRGVRRPFSEWAVLDEYFSRP